MPWKLKKKALSLLASEEGVVRKDWGGRVSVALVYPNTYAVGMSNLGFQTVYERLNALPDAVCERVFFPESLRPLREFDIVGFSVTYEGDYINVLRLLRMAGIPVRTADRAPGDPLVLMGGVCAFSNPEPLAPFMDAVAVGEGEELVGEIVAAYAESRAAGTDDLRSRVIGRLALLSGIYVPAAYDVGYASDGSIESVTPIAAGVPSVVIKRRVRDVNRLETRSLLKTPKAEYGHMALLEVGKGCGRGCRFCLEGQVYRPVRHRSLEALRES